MARWLRSSREHEQVEALLSPYLDGRVNQSERALVERHVQSCSECSRNLATLRATVDAVRAMPRVRAPRSFALPRSMARSTKTAPWLFPVLRTATAVATFLLIIVVAGDVFLRSRVAPTAAPMAAPVPVARELAVTSAPTFGLRQAAPTVQATRLVAAAEAYDAATPPAAATHAPAPPVEPPVEQPLSGGEAGPGLGGGGGVEPPGANVVAPSAPLSASPAPTMAYAMASAPVTPTTDTTQRGAAAPSPTTIPSAQPTAPKAAAMPTLAPSPQPKIAPSVSVTPVALPPPTEAAQVAPAPALQPPAANHEMALQAAPQVIPWLRIAQGMLAVLVLALGLMTWIVYRRSR